MKRMIINLTEKLLEEIDDLVKKEFYKNKSEIIRNSVLLLLEKRKVEELKKRLGVRD